MHIHGQPVPAHWHTDNIVHWGQLRQALRDMKRAGKAGGPVLSNGVSAAMLDFAAPGFGQLGKHLTDASKVVCLKIGFAPVKDSGSWTRIVSFQPLLQAYIGKFLAVLPGSLADMFLSKLPSPTLGVQRLEGDFDERFDALWMAAKDEYPAITRRDSTVLNWRYRHHPDLDYRVLAAVKPDGLRGYLVYSVFERHRQRRAQIVDILSLKNDTEARAALIASALRRMKSEDVHKVECYATSPILAASLKCSGFAPRTHKDKEQAALTRFLPEMEYYLTRGDGDGG
jgi:hypothetical protein